MPDPLGWWEPAPQGSPAEAPIRWRRVLRPRLSRAEAYVSLLTLALGFALAVTVRTHETNDAFVGARQEDLVQILDDLDSRANRLRQEVSTLNNTKAQLDAGSGDSSAALNEARTRAQQLGILAGTLGAKGEGIMLTITDPRGSIRAETLVDTIEELRDAGAEAIQIGGVRIVASSYVTDVATGVAVDRVTLTAPYEILAIGDPSTMSRAMGIPGGIIDSVDGQPGASATVEERSSITITGVRGKPGPQYSQSTPTPSTGSSP